VVSHDVRKSRAIAMSERCAYREFDTERGSLRQKALPAHSIEEKYSFAAAIAVS
jgi:hypothetical protein